MKVEVQELEEWEDGTFGAVVEEVEETISRYKNEKSGEDQHQLRIKVKLDDGRPLTNWVNCPPKTPAGKVVIGSRSNMAKVVAVLGSDTDQWVGKRVRVTTLTEENKAGNLQTKIVKWMPAKKDSSAPPPEDPFEDE